MLSAKTVRRLFSYNKYVESIKTGSIGYHVDDITQGWVDRESAVNAFLYPTLPEVIVRGKGVELFNINGKRFLDCLGGIGTQNFGHSHPKIAAAMKEQIDILAHTGRMVLNDKMVPCQELLSKTFGFDKSLMMNSGSEACKSAVKLAKRYGCLEKGIPMNESRVVFPKRNFWGRTIAAAGSSEDRLRSDTFGPFGLGLDLVDYNDLEALETYFKETPNCAAYMFEPVQGEGGVIIPDDLYYRGVRKLCTKYNVLMMCDEVQCGIGRTGYLRAIDYEGVQPDVLILAKAISAGFYPVSVVLADNHLMDLWSTGMHGSTFSSCPMACTAVISSLQVLKEEN